MNTLFKKPAHMRNYLYLFMLLAFSMLMNVSTAQAQCVNTPQLTSNGASIISSGIRPLCLFCSVNNESNLVDANTSNSARISIPVGLTGSGFIRVQLDKTYPAGTRAGFIADVNGGILSAFNGITLTAYLNGTKVGSRSGGSLINILGIGGGRNVNGVFCGPFNQLEIEVGSLVGVLANYDIDYAYVTEGCKFPVQCGATATPEICDDGIDNDGDGLVDNEDTCITCGAGTAAPSLTATTVSNICPATTANLTSITATNKPAGATLTFHTGTPATTANKVANPAAVAAGTYYAAFFDATNNCYSGAAGAATTTITATTSAACCTAAGITPPTLSTTTISNVCPATTVNLTSITASNQPANTTLTFHTGTPATNANKVANPGTAPAGTYYAAFFSAANNCYSGTGGSATTVVTATVTVCCSSGTVAPALSVTTISNVCPATTVNLTTITASNQPAGTTLTFHTGTPATTANKVANPAAAAAGTYYAAFFDATNNCYSGTGGAATTVVTATVTVCCSSGTTAPTLSTTTVSNVCPATTVNLTTITASNQPANTTLTFHTGTPATTANKVANPAAAAAGTYYAAFFDATNNCYSGTGGAATTVVTATVTVCCSSGTTAPTLTSTTVSNVCPLTTVNLTSITATNQPAGTFLTFHTGVPATNANKVVNPNAVTAGTYYAAFFDATNNCYSGAGGTATTVVTATVTVCTGPVSGSNPPTQTAITNQPKTGNAATELNPTGGNGTYVYSNGSSDPACINPGGGAIALPASSNLTVNSTTGAYTYTAPSTPGTYFFCIKVCDTATPASCTVKTYTVTVTAAPVPVSGSNPPAQTATTNQPKTGNAATELTPTGGNGTYVYSNGSSDPACINPGGGAVALPGSSNLTVNSSTGAYTYTAPSTPGTYFFCIKVCDTATPASCTVKTYTVTVTAAAAGFDLFPNFTFAATTYNVGTARNVVLNVNEIGGGSTAGNTIQVFVPFVAGFTYAFNPTLTSVTVLGTETVNNPNWTLTDTGAGYLFTSTTAIAGNGRSRIAISVTANTAGSSANLTANVTPLAAETNKGNNIAVLVQSAQN